MSGHATAGSPPLRTRSGAWRGGALALAASVVVALAVSGHGLLAPPLELTPTGTWLVRLGGVLALAGGVAVMMTQADRIRPPGARGPDPTIDALRTAAGLMAVVTLLAFLSPTPAPPEEAPATAPSVRPGAPSPGGDRGGEASARTRPPRGGPAARGSGGALVGRPERRHPPTNAWTRRCAPAS
ncbi:MAG: hypothetical protein RH859_11970 [Longimicrobiales bacterium]